MNKTLLLVCALVLCLFSISNVAMASPPWPDLSKTPDQVSKEGIDDAVVIIGVEDYAFVPDIPGALQNAQDWFTYMRKGRGVPLKNMRLLRNNDATREEILDALQKAAERVGDGGTLWVVFIGHGAPSKDGKDGILIGADAQQNARSLFARSVSQQEALAKVRGGAQAQTVFILDACFSGRNSTGGALVEGLQPLIIVQDQAPTDDLIIFAAAKGDEFAGALPGVARPAFSYLMLGALRGWADANADGAVSAGEANEYTQEVFQILVTDRRQTPTLSSPDPGLVVVSSAGEAAPNLDEILWALPLPSDFASARIIKIGSKQESKQESKPKKKKDLFSSETPTMLHFSVGMGFVDISNLIDENLETPEGLSLTDGALNTTFSYVRIVDTPRGTKPVMFHLDYLYNPVGLGVSFSMDFGFFGGGDAEVKLKASGNGSSTGSASLQDVYVKLTSFVYMGYSADLSYRYVFLEDFTLGVQLGIGLTATSLVLDALDASERPSGSESISGSVEGKSGAVLDFNVPSRWTIEYNLGDPYGVGITYGAFLYPNFQQMIQAGGSFLF